MNFKEIIKDSFRFASADWYNLILLGVVIVLTDYLLGIDGNTIDSWLDTIILIIILFLILLEAGYVFRILEETVHGSVKPPKLNRFPSLLIHGVKETTASLIYLFLPLILLLLSLGLTDDIIGIDLADSIITLFLILGITLGVIISIFYQGVLLNMAHNHGSLKSAFQFRQIWNKLGTIGIKRLLTVSFFIFIVIYILKEIIFDTLHTIPIIGDIIASLVIAPFLIIFTTRMLGLMDAP